jgi:hypothetical protein
MKKISILFSIICFFTSCEKEITDLIIYSDFNSLNDSSLYTTLSPSIDYEYFELRFSMCGDSAYQIDYSRGEICPAGIDTSVCIQEWEQVNSGNGFFQSCLPGCCHHYFVSKIDDQIQIYSDTESVISFLQPIDSHSDALMIAFTQGYYFRTGDSTVGGIRELEDKYQLIVLKLIGYCDPIQTNKYLLEINSTGEIKILETDIYDQAFGACI